MSGKDVWSPSPPLKLRAEDSDDLAVLSACLQDALVPLSDMAYLAAEKKFMLVVNRFRWECEGDKPRRHRERVLSGLCFENVVAVRMRGLGEVRRTGFLNLLAVATAEGAAEGDGPVVVLTFSGAAAVRLETSGLLCHLEDLGESWPTSWKPDHSGD